MRLNLLETALMNNPLRAAVQRRIEAHQLLELGGALSGGRALEIGCGRGVGVEIIRDVFGAAYVDAFDLDRAMVARARRRLRDWDDRTALWVGDATALPLANGSYEAVFDFGILHHVEDWRRAVQEIRRVLRPGGRFYCEEVYRSIITHPLWRRLFHHPQNDRFDHQELMHALASARLRIIGSRQFRGHFGWIVCERADDT